MEQGQVIGRVVVEAAGREIGEYPVTAGSGVEKMTLLRAVGLLWRQACAMG